MNNTTDKSGFSELIEFEYPGEGRISNKSKVRERFPQPQNVKPRETAADSGETEILSVNITETFTENVTETDEDKTELL